MSMNNKYNTPETRKLQRFIHRITSRLSAMRNKYIELELKQSAAKEKLESLLTDIEKKRYVVKNKTHTRIVSPLFESCVVCQPLPRRSQSYEKTTYSWNGINRNI